MLANKDQTPSPEANRNRSRNRTACDFENFLRLFSLHRPRERYRDGGFFIHASKRGRWNTLGKFELIPSPLYKYQLTSIQSLRLASRRKHYAPENLHPARSPISNEGTSSRTKNLPPDNFNDNEMYRHTSPAERLPKERGVSAI